MATSQLLQSPGYGSIGRPNEGTGTANGDEERQCMPPQRVIEAAVHLRLTWGICCCSKQRVLRSWEVSMNASVCLSPSIRKHIAADLRAIVASGRYGSWFLRKPKSTGKQLERVLRCWYGIVRLPCLQSAFKEWLPLAMYFPHAMHAKLSIAFKVKGALHSTAKAVLLWDLHGDSLRRGLALSLWPRSRANETLEGVGLLLKG